MSHDVYDLPESMRIPLSYYDDVDPDYMNPEQRLYDLPAELDPLEQLIREEEEAEEREEEETWKERQSDR